LVLFVHPDEEGLLVVVEDASTLGPVAVETACLQEAITLLEQEVVGDELVALGVGHGTEGVEGALEFSVEGVACLDDLLLDGVSLLASDGWAERELCQVAADSDASGHDHGGIICWEGWALELLEVHVTNVLGSLGVAMVLLDDFVHKRRESSVGVVGSGIDTNSRVSVLRAREDGGLE